MNNYITGCTKYGGEDISTLKEIPAQRVDFYNVFQAIGKNVLTKI